MEDHKRFGFHYDPSDFGYQGVDYFKFIRSFPDPIYHDRAISISFGAAHP